MIGFLSTLWGKIAGAALAILAILSAIAKIRRDGVKQGRAEERAKAQAAQTQAIKDRRTSDEVVENLADNSVRERLRSRWSRD